MVSRIFDLKDQTQKKFQGGEGGVKKANHVWTTRMLTSVTDIAPSMSCLFANTTKIAFFNSSSCKEKVCFTIFT